MSLAITSPDPAVPLLLCRCAAMHIPCHAPRHPLILPPCRPAIKREQLIIRVGEEAGQEDADAAMRYAEHVPIEISLSSGGAWAFQMFGKKYLNRPDVSERRERSIHAFMHSCIHAFMHSCIHCLVSPLPPALFV